MRPPYRINIHHTSNIYLIIPSHLIWYHQRPTHSSRPTIEKMQIVHNFPCHLRVHERGKRRKKKNGRSLCPITRNCRRHNVTLPICYANSEARVYTENKRKLASRSLDNYSLNILSCKPDAGHAIRCEYAGRYPWWRDKVLGFREGSARHWRAEVRGYYAIGRISFLDATSVSPRRLFREKLRYFWLTAVSFVGIYLIARDYTVKPARVARLISLDIKA